VIVLALLCLLIAFHLLNNWLWTSTNEVVFGFDRMFHQVTSLAYYDILREDVNLSTLFAALTWSDYYPPLVHLVVAGFYKLFGVSMDVAAMSNSLYLVALLLAVYGLGERLAGPWVGLLSAFIVSTFPMVFSMSRYLYVDFALASMVALNICLLLRSDRFRHKGYSLLYGLSLGLGMLTKWTFAAFTAVPLLLVIAHPETIGAGLWALHPATWDRRRLSMAGLLGLSLTALWFVPNIEATAALPLGYALAPLSWLLWSLTGYLVLAPPSLTPGASYIPHPAESRAKGGGESPTAGANLLAALALGACGTSTWYLTKINFIGTFWLNAYGKPTGRSWGFGSYLDFLYREQLSPIYAALFLAAILGLIWHRWRQTRSWRAVLALGVDGWALVLWVVVSFVVFSSRVSIIHSRYIMPLLPPLAIAIALWLSTLAHRWARAFLTGLVVIVALIQFSALSFDALADLKAAVPVFAEGLSIQLPASDRTDAGYWVSPDILATIQAYRDTERTQIGILVNKPQVNSKHFIYLAYAGYPQVQVNELATIGWAQPAYPRLFENDYILLIEPAPHYARRPDTEATIRRLLDMPDDTFHRAFKLAETYPMPDDTRLLLYERRFAPLEEADLSYYEALMADLGQAAQPGDALILMPPEQVYALGRYGDGSLPLYPLPPEPRPLSDTDASTLAEIGAEHSRLWVVLDEPQGYDPSGLMARWLAEQFYRADDAWYGSLQLALYAPQGRGDGAGEFHSSQFTWQGAITMEEYRFLDGEVPLGQILRLDVVWQASELLAERYKVFVHLLNEPGQVLSQRDSEPLAGLRPTSEWTPGEKIADKYGLWLPADLPPGEYRLVLGLYHPETGDRLPACCPATDAVLLATVRVEDDTARVSLAP
jgi:4-amino-4-deoxy-L-arabinose transferase-like glycosyltransferase